MSYYGITPAHLIGAPSLWRTVERFYYFAKDCIILVRHKSSLYNTPFDIFQWYAKSFGYVLNNPVLSMTDRVQAAKIKELFECKEKNVDYRDVLKVAANLDQFYKYELSEKKKCFYIICQYLSVFLCK